MHTLNTFLYAELGLSQSLVPAVTNFFREERIAKKGFMARKGGYCQTLSLIESGYMRFFSQSDKKEITHWIFGEGQIITDVASFYLQQPAKWNIQALTDVSLYSLSYTDFQKLRKEVKEWDSVEKLLQVKLMSALENRVYTLLSMSAEERYHYLFQSDSKMFNELPLQYLASMMGMSPETLSRIRAKAGE
ncbi:MAG: cyclic nucleotide-binding domain-containing protein [Bacteroidota bacterium]